MLLAIRQKNDLAEQLQLVCHGAGTALERAHARCCVVQSVSSVTRAATVCRREPRELPFCAAAKRVGYPEVNGDSPRIFNAGRAGESWRNTCK